MLDSLKSFFDSIKQGVLALIAGLGVIAYLVNLFQKKKHADLEAKLAVAETQKKVDLVEAEVKARLEKVEANKKETAELEILKQNVTEQRKALADQPNLTDQQIEDYWNNR